MRLIQRLLIIPLLFILISTQMLHAGGFHISILGVRRTGMMTTIAHPDDATALFHNPAALALLKGTQFHFSTGLPFLDTSFQLQALNPELFPNIDPKWTTHPRQVGNEQRDYYDANLKPEKYFGIIPYLGVTHAFSDRLVFGAALYAPGAYGASLPKQSPAAYFVTDGLFVIASATVGLGYMLIPERLSLGFNASFNYMQLGYGQRFSIVDVLDDRSTPNVDLIGKLANTLYGDIEMHYSGTDIGFGAGVGLWAKPFDFLEIGLGYGNWTNPSFNGNVQVKSLGNALNPTTKEALTTAKALNDAQLREDLQQPKLGRPGYQLPRKLNVNMTIPPALQAGLNFTFNKWQFGVDYRLWRYSTFKTQDVNPIYSATDPSLMLEQPITKENLSSDKGYSDSYEIAVGTMYTIIPQLDLMAGLAYDKSPVPDRTFSIDNPSLNQYIFSLGTRYRYQRWSFGLAYMNITYQKRDVTTNQSNPPVNAIVQGHNHLPTVEVQYRF